MATTQLNSSFSLLESSILEVLELKQCCTKSLSNDIVQRIRLIREKCQQTEKNEASDGGGTGQFAWRRGGSSNAHSGYITSSNTTSTNSIIKNNTGTSTSGGHTTGNSSNNTTTAKSSPLPPNQWRGQSTLSPVYKQTPNRQSNTPVEKSSKRYVSKFTNTATPVEDKILNQVILNKLNKFSQANYQEVKEFLQQILDSNESNFLRDFMHLVFKKAASEPTFCPLYARMISELSVTYKSLLKELEILYLEYITIFEEVSEDESKNYDQFVQRNREKLHRLGYSQFLGELTSVGILNKDQILKLYTTIFEQIKQQGSMGETKQQLVEEYVDCLLRMSKSFQKGQTIKLIDLRKSIGALYQPILEDILSKKGTLYPGISKKASFGLMDCIDIFKENS